MDGCENDSISKQRISLYRFKKSFQEDFVAESIHDAMHACTWLGTTMPNRTDRIMCSTYDMKPIANKPYILVSNWMHN